MNGLQKRIILKALDQPEDLSDGDYDFINSLADKDEDYELSGPQNKWLNDIWERLS